MKIIRSDNYGGEGPGSDDVLIAENINPDYADALVDNLNDRERGGTYYFRAVSPGYKLQKFEP